MTNVVHLGIPDYLVTTLNAAAAEIVAIVRKRHTEKGTPLSWVYIESPNSKVTDEEAEAVLARVARAIEGIALTESGDLNGRWLSTISRVRDRGLYFQGSRHSMSGGRAAMSISLDIKGTSFVYRRWGDEVRVNLNTTVAPPVRLPVSD